MKPEDARHIAKRAEFASELVGNPLWFELMEETRSHIIRGWQETDPEQTAAREAAFARFRALVDLNNELLRWRNAGVMLPRPSDDTASPPA